MSSGLLLARAGAVVTVGRGIGISEARALAGESGAFKGLRSLDRRAKENPWWPGRKPIESQGICDRVSNVGKCRTKGWRDRPSFPPGSSSSSFPGSSTGYNPGWGGGEGVGLLLLLLPIIGCKVSTSETLSDGLERS